MAVFLALPRVDTKPVADRLIAKFGDLAAVLAAPPASLEQVEGLGPAGVSALKLLDAVGNRLLGTETPAGTRLL